MRVPTVAAWEYDGTDDADEFPFPPDLFAHTDFPPCCAEWHRWHCSRLAGHTGRHAAGDARQIVAVWP